MAAYNVKQKYEVGEVFPLASFSFLLIFICGNITLFISTSIDYFFYGEPCSVCVRVCVCVKLL